MDSFWIFWITFNGPSLDSYFLIVNPVPYDKRLAKKKKFQTMKTSPIQLMDEKVMGTGIEKDMYIQLCRSIDLRPPKTTKDLQCKYESRGKPYYTYGPRKVEVVNLDPYIAVVHDFITNGEIKEFIKVASPKLKRSQMVGNKYNGSLSDYRVSEQTWINEQMAPNGPGKLTTRIGKGNKRIFSNHQIALRSFF